MLDISLELQGIAALGFFGVCLFVCLFACLNLKAGALLYR
jgi:hypothetical protein